MLSEESLAMVGDSKVSGIESDILIAFFFVLTLLYFYMISVIFCK